MFSSATDLWPTPQPFYDELDREFRFTLDPCSTHDNAKCALHYTQEDDGLTQEWAPHTVFMNPPYGREIKAWMQKAYEESRKGATVVCLVPARTDTVWFHDYVYRKGEIRFVKGRLKFGDAKNSAPFPSMVVVYRGKEAA
ncbi:DNA N-6-adenine-methyltransferase [Brevibacillus laterosporus]|uniref:DNA N-6-adenine-methyltransferase n=1 Tax=Bacillales TaxID=1385 RepID=UPI00163C2534|nr:MULTISPECIES: DNA N-6-adenine-methyltransferase [Bacillales]MCR8938775.1 phage N-6-adenine-methyltransferase [Brevibacillus laterosporus]MCZ0841415.1 DNA N-6-adenine-methyltransferase [Brevibacillus laterosporus]MCZ0847693.1 DNA N-6-adenine-methyltransferase [Brevibacillus laterosporus]MCZ0853343.1 DNA N-6-adenine-methyltransferase [Brevibacillus laterosporus]